MAKKKKHTIEVKFLDLKNKFKLNQLTTEQIDQITSELIAEMAVLTVKGFTEINGVPIDLYKDRTWWIVENIGLLPEYRGPKDEEEEGEIVDDYYSNDDEIEVEIDDSKFYQ
jgi:hypothetical protein